MPEQSNNYKKILIRFYSNVLDQEMVETFWSTILDETRGLYKLDNIPFYAPVASDDIVHAEYDEQEKMLTYKSTIKPSGNSTIQVILMDERTDIESIREFFRTLGCKSEKLTNKYFVMEVSSDMEYRNIKIELDKLEEQGYIEYAESCLSENHNY